MKENGATPRWVPLTDTATVSNVLDLMVLLGLMGGQATFDEDDGTILGQLETSPLTTLGVWTTTSTPMFDFYTLLAGSLRQFNVDAAFNELWAENEGDLPAPASECMSMLEAVGYRYEEAIEKLESLLEAGGHPTEPQPPDPNQPVTQERLVEFLVALQLGDERDVKQVSGGWKLFTHAPTLFGLVFHIEHGTTMQDVYAEVAQQLALFDADEWFPQLDPADFGMNPAELFNATQDLQLFFTRKSHHVRGAAG